MPFGVIASFIVVFALVMLAASMAMKFLDAKRKNQVAGMLQTAAGEAEIGITSLLKELEPAKPTGLKRLVSTMQFSEHAAELISQAGLDWSATRLLSAMGLLVVPGLVLGFLFPFLMNAPITAISLGLLFGGTPYMIVRQKRSKRLAALEEQFPEALDFLSRSMRAGHAFSMSLEMVGEELADPLGQEFRALFKEQNLGA